MPLEYLLTGVSRNFSISENFTMSSKLLSISAFLMPRMAPLMYMFSLLTTSLRL